MKLNASYWQERYNKADFPWDIGYANHVLTSYIEKNITKEARILVPGAGSAYEVEHLWLRGYKNIFALDYAAEAKAKFTSRITDFPAEQYLVADFFEVNQTFDVILEQTFFCALDPLLRIDYVRHIHQLLSTSGVLFGLLFEMDKPDGPPFGGNTQEYLDLFSDNFEIKSMQKCTQSIAPRIGSELEIEFFKK
jgi:thiopurine S-methyltransferase